MASEGSGEHAVTTGTPADGVTADGAVEIIQREMTVFARRARASAGRMHPELSLVSYTLLGHLEEVGDCRDPKVAPGDPTLTSVESTPETVRAWLTDLVAAGAVPEFVAMDNEPDLWGDTHYDVHPACPTYEEILTKYLQYATVVHDVMPDAELLGPALCCWYDYWNIAPGPEDGEGEQDFVAWFLDGVPAGTWTATPTPPPGSVVTAPAALTATITTAGELRGGLDFTLAPAPSPTASPTATPRLG